jgi:hypothetical protein
MERDPARCSFLDHRSAFEFCQLTILDLAFADTSVDGPFGLDFPNESAWHRLCSLPDNLL